MSNITSPEERAQMLELLSSGEYSTDQEAWMMDQIEQYDASQKAAVEHGTMPQVPKALGGFEVDPAMRERNMDTYAMGLRRFGFNAQEAALRFAKVLQTNEEALDRSLEQVRQKRTEYLDRAQMEFAQKHGGKPSEFKMMMAHDLYLMPLMFFPGSTMTRSALANAGAGGLASMVYGMETPGQALSDTAYGAAVGIGATYALSGLAGVRSYIGRQWVAEQNAAVGQQILALEEKIRQRTGNPDFTFSLSNIAADSPFLESLEKGAVAGSREAQRRQKRNLQTIVDSIERDIKQAEVQLPRGADAARRAGPPQPRDLERFGPTGVTRWTPANIVDRLNNRMVQAGRVLQGEARAAYGKGMDYMIENHGGDVLINGSGYLDNLEKLLVQDMGVGSGRLPAPLRDHIDQVRRAVEPATVMAPFKRKDGKTVYRVFDERQGKSLGDFDNPEAANWFRNSYNSRHGKITVEEGVAIMKSHNQLINGERNIFEAGDVGSSDYYGRYLKKSFLDNIQAERGSPAAETIQRINDQYAYDQGRIRTMRDSFLGSIFGGDPHALAANPSKALDELLVGSDVTRDTLSQTANILRQHAPELLPVIQREFVKRTMALGRRPASNFADVEADVDGLINALSAPGDTTNVGRAGIGLFLPGEQQTIIDAANALRVLRNTYLRPGQRDAQAGAKIQEASINMISQSAEFVARWLTRIGTSSNSLAHLMTDPRGRQALVTFAREGPDTLKGKLASVYLASWVGDYEATETESELEEKSLKRQLGD